MSQKTYLLALQTQSTGWDQVMDMRMINGRARPGVEHALNAQTLAHQPQISRQTQQRPGAGREQDVVSQLGLAPHPAAQAFGHGEGDHEVIDGCACSSVG